MGHALGGIRLGAHHKAVAHAGRPASLANPVQGQAVEVAPPSPTKIQPSAAAGKPIFSNHGHSANQFLIGNHHAANPAFRAQNDGFRFPFYHHHHHLIPPHYRPWPFPWLRVRFPHRGIWEHRLHGWRGFHDRDWGHGLHDGRDFHHRDWGHGLKDHEHHHLFHHLWPPAWWAPGVGYGRIGETRHDGWGHLHWEVPERREEHRPIMRNPIWQFLGAPPILLELRVRHGPVFRHHGWDWHRGDEWGWREEHEPGERRIWQRPPVILVEHPIHLVHTWESLHSWWGFHPWGWWAPHRDEWSPVIPHWFLPPVIPIPVRPPEWFRREGRHGWGEFHHEGWWEPHRERWYLGSDHWRRPPVFVVPPPFPVVVYPLAVAEPAPSTDASLAVAEGAGANTTGAIAGGTAGAGSVLVDGMTPPAGAGSAADSETAARDQFFAEGGLGHAGGQVPLGGHDALAMNDVFQGTPLAGDGLDLELPEWLRHKTRSNGG